MSFVTFVGMAFGPGAKATASLFTVVGYAVAAAAIVAISGGCAHDTIKLDVGIDIPWQLLCVISTGICGFLVARGVKISTTWAASFFYFELGLLLAGAVVMLVVNRRSFSWAPFLPSNLSGGLAGVGLGFPLAVYLFVGWENGSDTFPALGFGSAGAAGAIQPVSCNGRNPARDLHHIRDHSGAPVSQPCP